MRTFLLATMLLLIFVAAAMWVGQRISRPTIPAFQIVRVLQA